MKIIKIEKVFNRLDIQVDVTSRITSLEMINIKDKEDFKKQLKRSVEAAVRADEKEATNEALFTDLKKLEGVEIG